MINKERHFVFRILRLVLLCVIASCGFDMNAFPRNLSTSACSVDTFSVPVVRITNKDIETFVEERIIRTAEYAFSSRDSVIAYQMTVQPNENGTHTISVIAFGFDVPDPALIGYDSSIEKGDLYNSYVANIAGRSFLLLAKPDCPYIEVCNKQMKYIRKGEYTMWNDCITWYLSMSGDRLTDVCLDFEISPDITKNRGLRKDFYLLPKMCMEEPAFPRSPAVFAMNQCVHPILSSYLIILRRRNEYEKI